MPLMTRDSIVALLCVFIFLTADRSLSRKISTEIKGTIENVEIVNSDPPISCSGDETINLSETGLRGVPQRMVESSTIRSIILANNSIAEILPTAFEGARNLQCLDLAKNKISSIKILNLQHNSLRTLIVRYQHAVHDNPYGESIELIENDTLTPVPFTIDATESRLPNLEHLDLSGIEFRNFPYVNYPRLAHLYLNDRQVRVVNQEFFIAIPPSLRSLHLQRNNIEMINATYPTGIEAMYLDENPLVVVDIHMYGPDIKTLSVSNCNLTSLVNSTLLQGIPNLRSLDLSSNSIEELDEELFLNTPFLESLSLSKNEFSSFPTYLRFTEYLDSLSLSYNNINSLLYSIPWPSLKKLSLRGNKITSIYQNALSSLFMLQELDLAENQLQTLHGESLGWLQVLDLSFNRFTQIADMEVTKLPKLRQLFTQGNFIASINESDFHNVPDMCTVYIH